MRKEKMRDHEEKIKGRRFSETLAFHFNKQQNNLLR